MDRNDGGRGNAKHINIVLDVQVWSALALGEAGAPYADAVRYAARQLRTPDGGYAFSEIDKDGGYWLEGTAFAALAFRQAGMDAEADAALAAVEAAQLASGGLPAVANAKRSTRASRCLPVNPGCTATIRILPPSRGIFWRCSMKTPTCSALNERSGRGC